MKANELRIGNWVMYNDQNYTPAPTAIQISVADLILIIEDKKDCIYAPIPLTEEILLKCGFEKCINGFWDKSEIFNVKLYEDGTHIYLSGSDTNLNLSDIKYLHQLQNIYWCLVGKELEINL